MIRTIAIVISTAVLASMAFGQPRTVRDCPDCPDLVLIPAGSFTMGAAIGEEDAENVPHEFRGWSIPNHRVRIARPFYLGRDHVTRGQYAAFVKATGHAGVGCRGGRSWSEVAFAQTDDDPVVCVSTEDADAYVQWLSTLTGHAYRLPSEAEWEYAARAGTTTARYWGDDRAGPCRHAATGNCGLIGTVPVGHFPANAFGLYDMLGEAWQWTADCWNDSYQHAPADGSAAREGDCALRVVRGGAWSASSWTLRAAERDAQRPTYRASDVGFRVARAVAAP